VIAAVALGAGSAKPNVFYNIADQDQFAVRLRVNRNFYP